MAWLGCKIYCAIVPIRSDRRKRNGDGMTATERTKLTIQCVHFNKLNRFVFANPECRLTAIPFWLRFFNIAFSIPPPLWPLTIFPTSTAPSSSSTHHFQIGRLCLCCLRSFLLSFISLLYFSALCISIASILSVHLVCWTKTISHPIRPTKWNFVCLTKQTIYK